MNHTQQTMLKKKAIHRTPFFGEERDKFSANDHIKYIENERRENNYTDIETNYLLKLTLRDTAADWLEYWTKEHQEQSKVWENTRKQFQNEFGRPLEQNQNEKQEKQKQEKQKENEIHFEDEDEDEKEREERRIKIMDDMNNAYLIELGYTTPEQKYKF